MTSKDATAGHKEEGGVSRVFSRNQEGQAISGARDRQSYRTRTPVSWALRSWIRRALFKTSDPGVGGGIFPPWSHTQVPAQGSDMALQGLRPAALPEKSSARPELAMSQRVQSGDSVTRACGQGSQEAAWRGRPGTEVAPAGLGLGCGSHVTRARLCPGNVCGTPWR